MSKYLFLIISMSFFLSCKTGFHKLPNDLSNYGLKGPVKKVLQTYMTSDRDTEYQSFSFDRVGNLIIDGSKRYDLPENYIIRNHIKQSYYQNGKWYYIWKWHYNISGKRIKIKIYKNGKELIGEKSMYFDRYGRTLKTSAITFDEPIISSSEILYWKGLQKEINDFNSNKETDLLISMFKTNFEYDSSLFMIKETWVSHNGSTRDTTFTFYTNDSLGNNTKHCHVSTSDLTFEICGTRSYEYDLYGNWIRKVNTNSDGTYYNISTRVIEYY